MTDPRPLPPVRPAFTDASAPMTPDDQRDDPKPESPWLTSEQDRLASGAGQQHDQGSSSGRRLDQDPQNEPYTGPASIHTVDGIDDFNADDYEYVRIGGVVRAIPKKSVADEPETVTQAIPKSAMTEVVDPHFYVWLADGNVIRVKQSDLPTPAGTNAAYGHWQIENKVFQIVNVVPVEDLVKGEKE